MSNKRKILVYISGLLSKGDIKENTRIAREAAIKVWEAGFTAICPHLNTYMFHEDCKCEYMDYIEGDLAILDQCDAILMLEGWQESTGATVEYYHAKTKNLKIATNITELLKQYDPYWDVTF